MPLIGLASSDLRHTLPPLLADHALFHAPYNKLVQKAFARLMYHDMCK